MRKYRLVAKKGEGTFSEVLKAQNVKDGKYRAIKCMKNSFDSIDQVNNLREIQALRRLSPHEHIVSLEEVLYDQPTGRLALVFELMDANLYELVKGRKHYLNPMLVKSYMWQLMKALDHMHKKGIFHRDIKPENILIDKEACNEIGKGLKLADFGSCRGIYSKQPYTEYISTRWYRAPECLLTDGYYGPEMDIWGAGCVMFEITSLKPLFPGADELDQIHRIHKILGTPIEEVLSKLRVKGASHIDFNFPPQRGIGLHQMLSHATPDTIDLIEKMLKYDASERISAREAMRHPYFKEMREYEVKKATSLQQPNNNTNSTQSGTNATNELENSQNKHLPSLNTSTDDQGSSTSTDKEKSSQMSTNISKQITHNNASIHDNSSSSSSTILPPINAMQNMNINNSNTTTNKQQQQQSISNNNININNRNNNNTMNNNSNNNNNNNNSNSNNINNNILLKKKKKMNKNTGVSTNMSSSLQHPYNQPPAVIQVVAGARTGNTLSKTDGSGTLSNKMNSGTNNTSNTSTHHNLSMYGAGQYSRKKG